MQFVKTITSARRIYLRRQAGTSLLEAIAYLGIAAIVILGAVALLRNAFSSANTNRGLEEVTAIRTGVKKLYMGQTAGYGTDSMNSTLIYAKVFPASLAVNNGDVTNAWNGGVSVNGATANFTITYTSVPQDVCINMVSGGNAWVSVNVNGGADLAPPILPADATTACGEASNIIIWTSN